MLYENDFFALFLKEEKVIIRPKKTGFPLKSFDLITREYPRLKIISFQVLRKSLTETGEDHIIGSWLPLVEVIVASDKMTAQLVVNASLKEIEEDSKGILMEAGKVLDEAEVVYGRMDLSNERLTPGIQILAASGKQPEKGADALINYIDLPERKPVIRDDGSANYYEMNFVFQVNQGEWLGEKIPAQDGSDGIDIYGNSVPSTRGVDATLRYDRKSVIEEKIDGKIILRALHGGSLEFKDGEVSVGKHLTLNGDVGPETGSITFDGSITIYGTVLDGYSVVATGDVSIEGTEGVTNAKVIQSLEGDIYIKGGVFGGGTTIIEALGNIFIKHANNCKLYGENIHVGLYLLGSDVIADRVYVDKNRGKVIGGSVEAVYCIECAIAGNIHERITVLQATGIDKDALNKRIQKMAKELKERLEVVSRLEERTGMLKEAVAGYTSQQAEIYQKTVDTIASNKKAILELDKEIQLTLSKVKNEEPVHVEVTREAFPGTVIQIGNRSSTLYQTTKGEFKIVDGILNV